MAINDEARQVEIARSLATAARELAHSTRSVPHPQDSYALIGELDAAVGSLAQVCEQLARWHGRVVDGVHYAGEDATGDGATGTVVASDALRRASAVLATAAAALQEAHAANGVIRWFEDVTEQG